MATHVMRVVGTKIPIATTKPLPKSRRGAPMKLRGWQAKAYRALVAAYFRRVEAPTGSGKSTIMRALILADLLCARAQKAVVVVPQSIIASSFEQDVKLMLPRRGAQRWFPEHMLVQQQEVIKKLRAFFTRPLNRKQRTDPSRILVCTHAALVAYHKQYADDPRFDGVSLAIDEAHHARCGDPGDDDTFNGLGALISAWVKHRWGPLTVVTATWFRHDRNEILPVGLHKRFKTFKHTIAEHLAEISVEEVQIRYLLGSPQSCIKQCLDEALYDNTIIYQEFAGVNSDKRGDLAKTIQVLRDAGIRNDEIVDLVTDGPVRESVKDKLRESIRADQWHLSKPGLSYVVALMMGREGFDLPALQRAIVVGARTSIPMMTQMLGRLLRDYVRGRAKKTRVQFNIVLPFTAEDADNREAVTTYSKVMLTGLVLGCGLTPPLLRTKKGLTERERAHDAAVADEIDRMLANGGEQARAGIQHIVETAPSGPTSQADLDELAENALRALDGQTPSRARRDALVQIAMKMRRDLQKQFLDQIDVPEHKEDVLHEIKQWCAVLGDGDLRKVQRVMGKHQHLAILEAWNVIESGGAL